MTDNDMFHRGESMQYISNSVEETERLGAKLAESLPAGSIVAFTGDLGAGKTVFARGFARGLGVTEAVSSPTYTIAQEYQLAGNLRLYHLDLYRISSPQAGLAFGVDEFLNDPKAFALVEWPERIGDVIPDDAIKIFIRHIDSGTREISVND